VSGERASTVTLAAEVLLVVIVALPMIKQQIARKIGNGRNLFIRYLHIDSRVVVSGARVQSMMANTPSFV
jgi:hypothetical protein